MIKLKHDHRHKDGTAERLTQYGGTATNYGTETRQIFPADAYTAALIATGAANVWWFDLVPGEHFTYNLVRLGTDRKYSIRFDLRRPLSENPPPPWGEKEK
jgi:hypothetical protein